MTPSLLTIRKLLALKAESSIHYTCCIPLYIKGLRRRASQECHKSQYLLGLHYKVGFGVKANRQKEKYWHAEAARAGFQKAQQFLRGEMLDNLQSCFFDYDNQPNLRNPEILCGLGICYEQGIHPLIRNKPDLEKAFHYFQRASPPRLRHGHARYKVAEAYEHGLGVDQDMTQAVTMYHRATVRRHTGACLRLAQILEHGDQYPAAPKEALRYLKLGSRTGDAMCQYELAQCYLEGRLNAEFNEAKAVSLIQQSAKNGYPYAAYDLAKCYFQGKGVLRNPHKAKKLIEKTYGKHPDSDYIEEFWNTHKLWRY